MIDLKTARWELKSMRTLQGANGPVDFYTVLNHGEVPEDIISFALPSGRNDIAQFIIRCLQAGQNTLRQIPGAFDPDINRKLKL